MSVVQGLSVEMTVVEFPGPDNAIKKCIGLEEIFVDLFQGTGVFDIVEVLVCKFAPALGQILWRRRCKRVQMYISTLVPLVQCWSAPCRLDTDGRFVVC